MGKRVEEFLQRVEQTGMVSEPLLAELRQRVAETNRKTRPEMWAKLLVDRGELTPAQARKLVALTLEAPAASPPPPRLLLRPPPPRPSPAPRR